MTTDSPQAPDRPANRLAGETSPYLLQHAHNPVDWYPWGDEAFAKSRAEDTCRITRGNPGIPRLSCGGKYVPA